MYEPIDISIPATKTVRDVYIILPKASNSENILRSYYVGVALGFGLPNNLDEYEYTDGEYYCEKAIQEVYTITMPTKEQSTTITYYGSNGVIVRPYNNLVYHDIESVVKQVDYLNNAKARNLMRYCLSNSLNRHIRDTQRYGSRAFAPRDEILMCETKIKDALETVTLQNFVVKLEELIPLLS